MNLGITLWSTFSSVILYRDIVVTLVTKSCLPLLPYFFIIHLHDPSEQRGLLIGNQPVFFFNALLKEVDSLLIQSLGFIFRWSELFEEQPHWLLRPTTGNCLPLSRGLLNSKQDEAIFVAWSQILWAFPSSPAHWQRGICHITEYQMQQKVNYII